MQKVGQAGYLGCNICLGAAGIRGAATSLASFSIAALMEKLVNSTEEHHGGWHWSNCPVRRGWMFSLEKGQLWRRLSRK